MVKLLISIVTIASLVAACLVSYPLFTHRIHLIAGTIGFLVIVGIFIWGVYLLRSPKYKRRKPNFTVVFWSVVGITLVCTFAGIEPLSSAKDKLFSSISSNFKPTTTSTPTSIPTTPTIPTVQTIPPTSTPPAVVIPTIPTQPASAQQPLPSFVSISSDFIGSDLQGHSYANITVVFRFDSSCDSGYYYITLLSGSDSFGTKQVEWYRATRQIDLTWAVPAGKQAYYSLKNDDPISGIFQKQVSYAKFTSLNTVPRDSPSNLETEIVDLINRDRASRGLSLLAWDNSLYKQAIQRIKDIGEAGMIFMPAISQLYQESDYSFSTDTSQEASTVFQYWIIKDDYRTIMTNPNAKAIALRTDLYNNHKFYAIALFK